MRLPEVPVHFVCAVSRSLNVILLQKTEERTGPIHTIYSLIRNASVLFPRRLVEVPLPWARTMDQDTSNSSASQDEPPDRLSNADSTSPT